MYICSEDDVVSVSVPALLVKTGNGSAESFWHGRIGDGADAEPGRGVSEERGLLRRHDLFGALVREAVVVIDYDSFTYNCAEQIMVAKKAALFR